MRQTTESRKASLAKYNKSDKRKAVSARYRATEKGKATDRKHDLKHRNTPERKIYLSEYEKLPHVIARRKAYAARKESKELKYIGHINRVYKIGETDYRNILESQDGVCAICKTNSDTKLSVDHDHDTGRVRGLLCRKCNLGIGFLRDSVDFLRNAIDYLL